MQGKLHFLRAYVYCWKCLECLHYLAAKISAVYLDILWKKYLLFVFATMPTNVIFQQCLQTSFNLSSCLGRKHEQSVPRFPFNITPVFPHLIVVHETGWRISSLTSLIDTMPNLWTGNLGPWTFLFLPHCHGRSGFLAPVKLSATAL